MSSDNRDRTAYFREYARRNAAKRKAYLRRWAAENRDRVNAYARAWQMAKRRRLGVASREAQQPRLPSTRKAAKPKLAFTVPAGATLRDRFLAYRQAVNQA